MPEHGPSSSGCFSRVDATVFKQQNRDKLLENDNSFVLGTTEGLSALLALEALKNPQNS